MADIPWEDPNFENFDFGNDPGPDVPPRRGRPPKGDEVPPEMRVKGSKGSYRKGPVDPISKQKLQDLFNRVAPYMDAEHRAYMNSIFKGKGRVDIDFELEMLLRMSSLLFVAAMQPLLDEQRTTESLATLGNLIRQTAKDLHGVKQERLDREEAAARLNGAGKVKLTGEDAELLELEKKFGLE